VKVEKTEMKVHAKIMSEVTGFMKSRIILTAAELDLFTRLHTTPATAQELATETKTDLRALTRLLDCLVSFGLLKKNHNTYGVTEQGELNSSQHPETLLPIILHMADLWHTWSHLTDIITHGPNPQKKPLEGLQAQKRLESFLGAMHAIAQGLSRDIAKSYDTRPFKRLLDIGGGTGSYTIAFLENNPALKGVLFDLENVIPMAEARIRKQGLSDRVALVPGDFYTDELPRGCDLALLSAIIHQNSPRQNLDLYCKIYNALNNGGALLIRDHIMDGTRTKPVDGTVFAVNMLVNTPGGDTYTFDEIKETLEKAGFSAVKWVRAGDRMDSLVEAKKHA